MTKNSRGIRGSVSEAQHSPQGERLSQKGRRRKQFEQIQQTRAIASRLLMTTGEQQSPDWYTRARAYLEHRLEGRPLGGLSVPEDAKAAVRQALASACEETGYQPPMPKPRSKKSRKKR